jgi:hypothetical protein
MDEMTHKMGGNRRYGVLARFGALTISLALAACTAGSTHGTSTGDFDVAAVEAPDAMLVSAPDSLLHLSEADLKSTMGEPEFVWEEAGASMWRYDATGCAVFVYLYPDGVRHVDVRGEGLSASERSDCFHNMVVSRAKS